MITPDTALALLRRTAPAFAAFAWLTGFTALLAVIVPVLHLAGTTTAFERIVGSCTSVVFFVPLAIGFAWSTVLLWRASRHLQAATNRRSCQVASALLLVVFPLGTLIGVWALYLLTRPGLEQLFAQPPPRDGR